MPSYKELKSLARQLGVKVDFASKAGLRKLADHIAPDEEVRFLVAGKTSFINSGILALTGSRLILSLDGANASIKLDDLRVFQHQPGFTAATIHIRSNDELVVFKAVPKRDAEMFAGLVSDSLAARWALLESRVREGVGPGYQHDPGELQSVLGEVGVGLSDVDSGTFEAIVQSRWAQTPPADGEDTSHRSELVSSIREQIGGSWTAYGVGGHVAFDGAFVEIAHTGTLGRLSVGKGAKRIPVHQITSVQIKPAGAVVSGYIQFTLPGGNESRAQFGSQTFDAAGDENSMLFTLVQQSSFEQIRDEILEAIERATRSADPSAGPAESEADAIPRQIEQLADLLAKGILTDEEFASKKRDLLDRM